MKRPEDTGGSRFGRDGASQPADKVDDWTASAVVRSMSERLKGSGRRVVARAPGRLDVIGGFSDYAGASVVYLPSADCAHVAIQVRDDRKILITDVTSPEASTHEPTVIDSGALTNGSGQDAPQASRADWVGDDVNGVVRATLGTIAEGQRLGVLPNQDRGLSIVVHAGSRALACCGRTSAVCAGALAALAHLAEVHVDVSKAANIARHVERVWFGIPAGGGDGACAWAAHAEALGTFHGGTEACGGFVAIPQGAMFLGLHCGTRHVDAEEKFRQARTATFMGNTLIQRIAGTEVDPGCDWDGALARIGVARYVKRFRDRVPTRIRGEEFLKCFGKVVDDSLRVDPRKVYKVRSRTEHHIYEQARSAELLSLAAKATAGASKELLTAMGEAMYGSHWSYGQRCGLGSIETDLLVNLIRERGVSSGLYGARISGRGCGGIVVVLMESSDVAREALDHAIEKYSQRTGHTVTKLCGSVSGVSIDGIREC